MFESKIERQIQSLLEPYEDRIQELERHLIQLNKRVESLEQQIEAHSSHPIEISTDKEKKATVAVQPSIVNSAPTDIQTEGKAPQHRILFMTAPNDEGVFTGSSETEQVGKSIYQLSTTDGVHGTFIMLDTPDAIATAMISVSQFVKTACKVQGNLSPYPQQIQTLEEGTAVLENDSWRITNKAIVKFG